MKRLIIALLFINLFFTGTKSIYAAGATLKFIPDNLEFNLGNTQTAQIYLDPKANNVIGVDLFIRFDPQFVKVNNVIGLGIFSSQTALIIDNNAGLVKSAFSNGYGVYQNTPASFAQIEFEGKNTTSQTAITFDFVLGRTNDTNVAVSLGRDVLESVSPIILTIDPTNNPQPSSTPNPDTTPTPTPVSSSTPNPSNKPGLKPSPSLSLVPSSTPFKQPSPTPFFIHPSPYPIPRPPPWWQRWFSWLPWFRRRNDQVLGATTDQGSIFNLGNGLLILGGLIVLFIAIKLLRKFVFKEKEGNT